MASIDWPQIYPGYHPRLSDSSVPAPEILPGVTRYRINKHREQIRYEDETEDYVTVIIEPKEEGTK